MLTCFFSLTSYLKRTQAVSVLPCGNVALYHMLNAHLFFSLTSYLKRTQAVSVLPCGNVVLYHMFNAHLFLQPHIVS